MAEEGRPLSAVLGADPGSEGLGFSPGLATKIGGVSASPGLPCVGMTGSGLGGPLRVMRKELQPLTAEGDVPAPCHGAPPCYLLAG